MWAMPVLSASVKITIKAHISDVVYPPYYAVYLADNKGKFVKTLQVIGLNYTYQRDITHWFRNAIRNAENIDALSGASLKSGQTWTKSVFIDNTYINNNYQIVIDSASRQHGNQRKEAVVRLDPNTKKTTTQGKNHTEFMTVLIR